MIVADGALHQRTSEEGAFFVVKSSFLMGTFMTGALGKWESGRARKQALIIPKAVIRLMDRGN